MTIDNSSTTVISTYGITNHSVAAFIPVLIMTIIFNSLVIITCFKINVQQDITKKVIFHLAVTDCVLASSILATSILRITLSSFPILGKEYYVCVASFAVALYMSEVSIFFVTFANFERFLAICKRAWYLRLLTRRNVSLMMGAFWILPSLVCVIAVIDRIQTEGNSPILCVVEGISSTWRNISFSVFTFVMILTSLLLYCNVIFKAREYRRRVIPSEHSNVTSDSNTQTISNRRSLRNGKVVGIITFILMVCWTPFSFQSLFIGLRVTTISEQNYQILFVIACFNGVLNPFMYAWQRRDLRRGLIKLICRKRQSGAVNRQN